MKEEENGKLVEEFLQRILNGGPAKVMVTWINPKKENQKGKLLFQNNSFWILLPDGSHLLIPLAETFLDSSAEILTIRALDSDQIAFEFTIKRSS